MAQTTRAEIRNERTRQVIERINGEIEDWTMAKLAELRMTHRSRQAAEHAFNKVVAGRRYLLIPKHTEEERYFLRLMIMLAIAKRPGLQSRAPEVADYYSTAYPFEWTQSPIARPAIRRAQDMILSAAESEFGETPMAPALAYVYHHHNTLNIRNVSSYGECYTHAASLTHHRHFVNLEQAWRERLGLQTIAYDI
jgi:hypothetical protein